MDDSGDAWIGSGSHTPPVYQGPGAGAEFAILELSNSGVVLSLMNGYGFGGGGLDYDPYSVAIDGSGNVWAATFAKNTVSEFSSSGTPISPSTGFMGTGLNGPYSVAMDGSGNAWITDGLGGLNLTVTKMSPSAIPGGTPSAATFSAVGGGVLNAISAIAVDGTGNVWAVALSDTSSTGNSVTEFPTRAQCYLLWTASPGGA